MRKQHRGSAQPGAHGTAGLSWCCTLGDKKNIIPKRTQSLGRFWGHKSDPRATDLTVSPWRPPWCGGGSCGVSNLFPERSHKAGEGEEGLGFGMWKVKLGIAACSSCKRRQLAAAHVGVFLFLSQAGLEARGSLRRAQAPSHQGNNYLFPTIIGVITVMRRISAPGSRGGSPQSHPLKQRGKRVRKESPLHRHPKGSHLEKADFGAGAREEQGWGHLHHPPASVFCGDGVGPRQILGSRALPASPRTGTCTRRD